MLVDQLVARGTDVGLQGVRLELEAARLAREMDLAQ